MRELTIEGITDDGRNLVARDPESGEEFHIQADDRLRGLIRPSAGTMHGRLEKPMETSLSPRDIQARVRQGASPEELAETTGMALDRIAVFAVPVLAEREHKAERARASALRRRYAEGAVTLEAALREHVPHGRIDTAVWDSWLRSDGKWTVSVSLDGAAAVEFVYDVQGRYVIAASAVASELIGDTLDQPSEEMEIAQAVSAAHSRIEPDEAAASAPLVTAPGVENPVEQALQAESPEKDDAEADDAVHLDHDEPPAGVASLKRARDRRAMGQLALGLGDEYSQADSSDAKPSTRSEDDVQGLGEAAEPALDMDVTEEEEPADPPKKRERRRVPSWDEIMFGNSSS